MPYNPEFLLTIHWQFKKNGIVNRNQGDTMRIDATTLETVAHVPHDNITPCI